GRTCVDGFVDRWTGTLALRGRELFSRALEAHYNFCSGQSEFLRQPLDRGGDEQDIARGIGVQFAPAEEVVVRLRDLPFVGAENAARFFESPGVKAGIVPGADVAILGIEVAAA